MVSNTSPCPPNLICVPSYPTAPTYEFGSISVSYAPEVTTGLGLFFWPQYHKHPDSPLSSPPPSPPETTAPLPEQESDLTTPYWVNNNNDEGNLPPKFRSSERPKSKSSVHASSLLPALELNLLRLPVLASPSGTPESTISVLPDTTLTGVNDFPPLPRTPIISALSPLPSPSPFSLRSLLESPATKSQPLSPLLGVSSLETPSSPEVHRRSTSEIERQSSIAESPPESESPFILLHPTDKKYNPRYYMQRTRFTRQEPIDLPSLSLQPQSDHSQSASEFESVVDSSSAVQHNFTTELRRDDRDPIVHPSRRNSARARRDVRSLFQRKTVRRKGCVYVH